MTVTVPPGGSRPGPRARVRTSVRPKDTKKAPPSVMVTLFAFAVVFVYVISLGYSFTSASAEVWGALLLLPVLIGLTIPLLTAAGRHEDDPRLARLLIVALVLKMVGACVRYAIAFNVYSGEADAKAYDAAGRVLAANFRSGHLNFGTGAINNTHFIEVLTGFVYTVIGSTQLGGFFVFSWFGFIGLFLFYRAFAIAMPQSEHRRYALLLFFMPSLLFWSSSIGKEAWMTLTLGAVAYGAARSFTRKPFGFVFIALGVWGAEVVRPHMALLILAGLLPAYLLRRSPNTTDGTRRKQSLKIFGAVLLVAAIVISIGGVEQRFKVSDASVASANQVFNDTADSTTTGGSSFTPTRVNNPIELPIAFVTVMFRPFPNEASTAQGIVSSIEGMFLIGLSLVSIKRLLRIPREMVTNPFVMFALVYTLLFVYAFSTIGNFGILVRERVQVYPMFFVLLCIPKPAVIQKGAKAVRRSYSRT